MLSEVGDGEVAPTNSPKSAKSLASREDVLRSIDLVPGKAHSHQLTSPDSVTLILTIIIATYYVM